MAGGGGSTGGIGAQSPAVNPPNPVGQIGNAVGGALGGMGGQPQNPMGGGNFVQTGEFGSQPISMGNNPAYNGQPQGPMGGMSPDYATTYPTPSGFGGMNGQPPMETPTMDSQIMDSMQQAQARQQTLSPTQMAEMQQAFQAARQAPQQPFVFQDDQQRAPSVPQNTNAAGLMALLGGKPIQPTPTAPPTPTAAPTPTARPAPVATKSLARPSIIPPKTPPGVASAIQKLAAKKPLFGRR